MTASPPGTGDGLVARYLTLLGGETVAKLCVLLAFARLARVFGPAGVGIIELAIAATLLLVTVVEGGMSPYGARVIATTPQAVSWLVPRIVVLRSLLSVGAYALILAAASQWPMPAAGVLLLFGLTLFLTPFTFQWVFQGLRLMRWVAAGTAVRYAVFATVVFLFVRPGSDLRLAAAAELSGVAALVCLNGVLLRRAVTVPLDWTGGFKGTAPVVRETWSLAASDLAGTALWYVPSVLLGWLASPEHVAWQAGSVRIVVSLHTFVWQYFFNLLPNLARELQKGPPAWRTFLSRSLSASMWTAFLIVLGGTLLGRTVLSWIYGSAYEEATRPFQITLWMIPLAVFGGHFLYSLIAGGEQRWTLVASLSGAAVTILLGVGLIPWAQSTGAALALVAGGVSNAALALLFVTRRIGRAPALAPLLRPVVGFAGCLLVGEAISLYAGSYAGAVTACAGYLTLAIRSNGEVLLLARAAVGRRPAAPEAEDQTESTNRL